MSVNTKLIEDFCRAWSRLDPAELAAYFTEDGVYMPAAPVNGRKAIERFIRGFTSTWTKTEWEIRTLLEAGDVVVVAHRPDACGREVGRSAVHGRVRDARRKDRLLARLLRPRHLHADHAVAEGSPSDRAPLGRRSHASKLSPLSTR